MSEAALDNETALRIALASRALPEIDTGRLIEVLIENLGEDLNTETLKKITVTHLKTGLGSLDGEEDGEDIGIGLADMKEAVRILWGEEPEVEKLPVPADYKEGDMPGSIRVAISSNSGDNLDGHFGSCLRYLIYQVSPKEVRLVGVRSSEGADDSDDRNGFRINLIKDCNIVYVVSVGGPAAAKIVQSGIFPMKLDKGGPSQTTLYNLQKMMENAPPPWLAKILGRAPEERVKNYGG